MLTKRPEPYWQAHTEEASIPDSLKEDLKIWGHRGSINSNVDSFIELLHAASYQYVMYVMGFKPDFDRQAYLCKEQKQAERIIQQNPKIIEQMLRTLPPHRQYIQQ